MNSFKQWMRLATPDEQMLLAEKVGTSRQYLYRLATEPDLPHARQASADLGKAIEHQTAAMHRASKGRLPRLYRTDLVPACRNCEFAQRCLGPLAVRSEFPVVTTELLESLDTEGGTHD